MYDRFDLEQDIMKCWSITDDIQALCERVVEDEVLDRDRIANYLLGLQEIYNIKFDKLFAGFENLMHQGKIL